MALEMPPGTRLILASEDLLDFFGTRMEDGRRITFEWGEPDEHGWYEPTFTTHADPVVEAAIEFAKRLVDGVDTDLAKRMRKSA